MFYFIFIFPPHLSDEWILDLSPIEHHDFTLFGTLTRGCGLSNGFLYLRVMLFRACFEILTASGFGDKGPRDSESEGYNGPCYELPFGYGQFE